VTAPVFLCSELDGDRIELTGTEGRHASTVRRLRVGEHADLTDGSGLVVSGIVSSVADGAVTFSVLSRRSVPRPSPSLTVVQALPKGERGELAVETMTEAGVDVIVPWAAEHSVAVWRGEKASRGVSRWRSAAREASKQSRRAWLPSVLDLASTGSVASLAGSAALAIVLEGSASCALSTVTLPTSGEIVVIVGPEGGVSPAERSAFAAAGAVECRLGPTVLRTSTAGVAATAVISARTGRWLTRLARARRGPARARYALFVSNASPVLKGSDVPLLPAYGQQWNIAALGVAVGVALQGRPRHTATGLRWRRPWGR
jgi:16S rRNA (uracil1498-N3)-methyltransferase